jgi:hypothetical protein
MRQPFPEYTICPADNATAGSLGRRRAGQLRFGFVAVSAGHICVVHLLSEGVPSREDTFLSWHLAPVSEVTRELTLLF